MTDQFMRLFLAGFDLDAALRFQPAENGPGKELLLFIHGLGCAKETYAGVWDRTEFAAYDRLALDLPGFGRSGRPEGPAYDLEEHAEACRLVLNAHPHERLHIVAHSMGGAVGLLLADRLARGPASFANIEGNLIGADCGLSRPAAQASFSEFKNHYLPGLLELLSAAPLVRDFVEAASPLAFYKSAVSLVRWSDSEELLSRFRNLACPKLYVYGEQNAHMPILRRLKNIPTRMIPESGHFPMLDNPDPTYAALLDLLARA